MRTVFPDSVEDELKAEFFAESPAGFFVEVGSERAAAWLADLAVRTGRLERRPGGAAARAR